MADTAVAEPPAGLEGAEDRFNAIIQPEAAKPDPAKPDPSKADKPEPAKPDEAFPAEFLTGEKPETKAAEQDADIAKLLAAEPPAQLRSEAAKESFKTWKADAAKAIEARNARNADLEKQLAALKANGTQSEEMKAAIKERDDRLAEREAMIERIAFERSPKFQALETKAALHITAAKSILEGTEIDPSVIDVAAQAKGRNRLKILSDAGVEDRMLGPIEARLSRWDEGQADKAEAIEHAKGISGQWDAEHKQAEAQKQAHQRAEEDRIFTQVGETVTKSFEPFQDVPGNEKWNEQAKRLRDEAKAFFNGDVPLDRVAEIAYYGVGAKVVHQMFHSLREKFQAAQAELKALKAAQPGGGSLHSDGKAQPENLVERSVQTFEGFMHGGG